MRGRSMGVGSRRGSPQPTLSGRELVSAALARTQRRVSFGPVIPEQENPDRDRDQDPGPPRTESQSGAGGHAGAVDAAHLREALRLAGESAAGGGGPFGAVVAREGEVLARGSNAVVESADPTAHAEIVALRGAARALGTHELRGCVLYTSCEPCPMCLGAAWWARVERVVYAAGRADAAAAGFDDEELYRELALPLDERSLRIERLLKEEGRAPFEAWLSNADRVPY